MKIKCIVEGLSRLNQDGEVVFFGYREAKKAVELFEAQYIGQNQRQLWEWAVKETLSEK